LRDENSRRNGKERKRVWENDLSCDAFRLRFTLLDIKTFIIA
jgi:hypothetical protein